MGSQDYDRQDAESFKGHVLIGAALFAICIVIAVIDSGNAPTIPDLPQTCQNTDNC